MRDAPATASSRLLVMARILGSSPATVLGVNAWLTMVRSFRCRGGSMVTNMPLRKTSKSSWTGVSPEKSEENVAGSDSTRSTVA
jgi:hypothetical protein